MLGGRWSVHNAPVRAGTGPAWLHPVSAHGRGSYIRPNSSGLERRVTSGACKLAAPEGLVYPLRMHACHFC